MSFEFLEVDAMGIIHTETNMSSKLEELSSAPEATLPSRTSHYYNYNYNIYYCYSLDKKVHTSRGKVSGVSC